MIGVNAYKCLQQIARGVLLEELGTGDDQAFACMLTFWSDLGCNITFMTRVSPMCLCDYPCQASLISLLCAHRINF